MEVDFCFGFFVWVFWVFLYYYYYYVSFKTSIYISDFSAPGLFYLSVRGTAILKVAIKWHHSKGQHYGPDLLMCAFVVVGLVLVCLFF